MRARQNSPQRSDRAAALVTVLTMLAVMSTLAVVVVDAANMSVRRTDNLVRMEQTWLYLMGAEAFARSRLAELREAETQNRVDESEWQARALTFPLDDGALSVTLFDGNNCFNLNSLVVTDDAGERSASALGMVQFSRLLDIVGARPDQIGLSATLVDWLDSDGQPMAGGGEDVAYDSADIGHRPANALLADVGELRRVRGFDSATIEALAPYVCVRPTSAPNAINPNTLRPEQAALLSMAFGGDLPVSAAEAIIGDRPRGGWDSVDAFLSHPRVASFEINESGRAQFSLQTRYYVLVAQVERDRGRDSLAALLEVGPAGEAVVLRRLYGAGTSEHSL
jgi:general secretion pathway protein K